MSAKATPMRREIELDFIRGIAILLVLMFHFRPHVLLLTSLTSNRIEQFGWVGVDIFFVLSGFLVGGLMMKEWSRTGRVDVWLFLKRRAFKIWPAYYFFLLVVTIIHVRPLNSFLWQNLLNVQNYFVSSLSHTWSLAVEEHFYLALAAIVLLWNRNGWTPLGLLRFCLLTSVLVEVLRAFLMHSGKLVFYQTHVRIDALLIGVSLACLKTFWPERFKSLQRQRILLLTLLALAVWRLWADRDAFPETNAMRSPFLVTFVDYASAALLLLLYRPGEDHRWLYRQIARLGVFSYGVYLWHVSVERPADWVARHVPHGLTAVTSSLLPYVLAIGVGIVATKAVELPFLRLRERVLPPRTPEPRIPAG